MWLKILKPGWSILRKKQDILYELSPHELVPQCQQTPGGVIIPSEL